MICRVKKKTTLLIVNVKAEGFSIAALLVCEDSQGNKVNLLPTGVNLINLGEVRWFYSFDIVFISYLSFDTLGTKVCYHIPCTALSILEFLACLFLYYLHE